MRYHIFNPAVNTAETGSAYPQIQKMAPSYNYKSPNSVYALSKATVQFPDYIPDLDYFIMDSRAKITDLLSVSVLYGGFLISPKLKMLLQNFSLPTHRFYPAKVSHKKSFYDYFWMHIICDLTDNVDYLKSEFMIYYNYRHDLGNIDIASKQDFIEKKNKTALDNAGKNVTIWAKKISIFKDQFNNLDLFEIGTFDNNYYISEPLHLAILEKQISGVHMSEATNLTFTV